MIYLFASCGFSFVVFFIHIMLHSFMIYFHFFLLLCLSHPSTSSHSVVKWIRSLQPRRGLVPAQSGLVLPSKSLPILLQIHLHLLFLHSEVVVEAGLSADARLPLLLHADPRHAPPILQDPQLEGSSIHFIYFHHAIIITPLPDGRGLMSSQDGNSDSLIHTD